MAPERQRIPEWSRSERGGDLEWIGENLGGFWPLAKEVFKEAGRGVIVVDVTSQPEGKGHPFGYFSQEELAKFEDEDTDRMLNNYDTETEFVILVLKTGDRTSTYRVKPLEKRASDDE
jgi:hypothetical protein